MSYPEGIGRAMQMDRMPTTTAMPPQDDAPLYQALNTAHNRLAVLNDHMQSLLDHVHGPSSKNTGCSTQPASTPSLMDVKRSVLDCIARLEEQFQILASSLS